MAKSDELFLCEGFQEKYMYIVVPYELIQVFRIFGHISITRKAMYYETKTAGGSEEEVEDSLVYMKIWCT